jgi:hypothetical protein
VKSKGSSSEITVLLAAPDASASCAPLRVRSGANAQKKQSLAEDQRRVRQKCGSMDIDHHSARNLRHSLSPKAKPWDSGNMDQERRSTRTAVSLEHVDALIPSHDFLLSC